MYLLVLLYVSFQETINQILKRNNLIKEDKPKVSKSKEYPDQYINVQQIDLICPRYLKRGFKFYIFNIIDIGNHFAGVYPIINKKYPIEFYTKNITSHNDTK